ncbi:TIGR02757 family protein [bacterium]|nr:TIGR02757 family protein [bacterium]
MISHRKLRPVLDRLYESYLADFKRSPEEFFRDRMDPLVFAHRYTRFHDIEAAAFLASTFAYGNVRSLCGFIEKLLNLLQPSPYHFLKNGPDALETLTPHAPYYRLHKTEEILSFLSMLALIYRDHGSLYEVFLSSYDDNHTMTDSISSFVARLYEIHGAPIPFLLPSPDSGSPCKRLNLFLRWMVRKDGLDLGIWKDVSPADLIIPLDTHIGRVAFHLGWIHTPSLSWKKAEQVTKILRRYDPEDPIRYDFSLCHESMMDNDWLNKVARASRLR